MKPRAILFILIIGAVLIVLKLRLREIGREVPIHSPSSTPSILSQASTPLPIPIASSTQKVSDKIPSIAHVRDEVAKDPHSTPASLLSFAADLAPKMEAGMKDEKSAQHFIEELKDCALGNGAESARALCLSDAQMLSKKFPSLQPQFENILDHADPRVSRLADVH